MQDIVYFVKDTPENEELRYSLRSLVNFPHRRVWFYGGMVGDQIRATFPNKCKYEV